MVCSVRFDRFALLTVSVGWNSKWRSKYCSQNSKDQHVTEMESKILASARQRVVIGHWPPEWVLHCTGRLRPWRARISRCTVSFSARSNCCTSASDRKNCTHKFYGKLKTTSVWFLSWWQLNAYKLLVQVMFVFVSFNWLKSMQKMFAELQPKHSR